MTLKDDIDRAIAAHGSMNAMYQAARRAYDFSEALGTIKPTALEEASARTRAMKAIEATYLVALTYCHWGEAIALRTIFGSALEALGAAIEKAKADNKHGRGGS